MEFFTFASNLFRLRSVLNVLRLRRPFLILHETDFCFENVAIYILKCLIAGYGVRKVVPKTATLALAAINLSSYLLYDCELYEVIHAVLKFATGIFLQFLFDDSSITTGLNGVIWFLYCFQSNFLFFLDVYVVVTAFVYVLQVYRDEFEKGCAMILYLCGIGWLSNYYIGEDQVDMMHAFITLYLPVMMLAILKPANIKYNRRFFYIAIFTSIYLFLRLREAALANGIKDDIWTQPMKYLYNCFFGLMDLKQNCKMMLKLLEHFSVYADNIYCQACAYFNNSLVMSSAE